MSQSLGNHEFDNGVAGLVPFLNEVSFPVVTANLDLSLEPTLRATKRLTNSTVLLVNGHKIGVAGYLTPDTKSLSNTGQVGFVDEVLALRREVAALRSEGCTVIIALGHSGFEADKRIAREVEHVDLVIGGHTNTFLYSGAQPDSELPEGPYPYPVEQADGRRVYVVQAYAFTKYLGNLSVQFDAQGEVRFVEGNPIVVDASVPMAEDVARELRRWTAPLANSSKLLVGETKVLLEGDEKVCRLQECNMGDLLTDAMIRYVSSLSIPFTIYDYTKLSTKLKYCAYSCLLHYKMYSFGLLDRTPRGTTELAGPTPRWPSIKPEEYAPP